MNQEQQIETLATLVSDVKHLVRTVDEMRGTVGGLATRAELANLVTRAEFENLKAMVERTSPRSFWKLLTEISVGIAAFSAAAAVVGSIFLFVAKHS